MLRRCPTCQQLNIVREEDFVCVFCDEALPLEHAELLTSELTTNSVRHTKGPAAVRLQWWHPVLRISVWDMSPDLPKPYVPPADPHAEAGRGMAILELVADRWGRCAIGEGALGPGGKTVWFELALGA
ncbi:ATP-binding protein [Streptomyces sp. NPDC087849]|uniref:ATP-binding protein n=1 Tax=Streptomyces sp. NPDC087849 TaxID=3365808 RepID=UPI0037F3B4AE